MKLNMKPQNQLICELYVKHRMYKELREFKRSLKSPDPPTTMQKYLIIDQLIQKEKNMLDRSKCKKMWQTAE